MVQIFIDFLLFVKCKYVSVNHLIAVYVSRSHRVIFHLHLVLIGVVEVSLQVESKTKVVETKIFYKHVQIHTSRLIVQYLSKTFSVRRKFELSQNPGLEAMKTKAIYTVAESIPKLQVTTRNK